MPWDARGGSLDFDTLRGHFQSEALMPSALIEALRQRIQNHADPAVWIHLLPWEEVRSRAAALDKLAAGGGFSHLPLYGIPFAVKDNIDVAGHPTTAACPAFAYTARESAPVVARLEAAGAILLGKTNMDQFATGLVGTRSPYGAVANAFAAEYVSGGSSSGSAVAVADGLVSFALGTDTAGSGRVPAAFQNIVGLKPSHGLLSARGVVPACRSLDCVSVFALGCGDALRVFRAAQAPDAGDPFSRPLPAERRLSALGFYPGQPAAFRFGIPEAGAWPAGEYGALFRQARERLEALGGTAVEIPFAPFEETGRLLYQGPWLEERKAAFGAFAEEHPESVLPVIRQVLSAAGPFTAAAAYQADYRLRTLRTGVMEQLSTLECLVFPTVPGHPTRAQVEADPLGANFRLGRYCNAVNLLGLCALAVPAGFTSAGLPFGITLISPPFQEGRLAALGARFHAAPGARMGNSRHPVPGPAPLEAIPGARVAVAGLHLSGQPLNRQLQELDARLLRVTRTAPAYRMYLVQRGDRIFPGLLRVPAEGASLEVEVWEMTEAAMGSFLDNVREPLCLGTLELEDGERLKGFLCEAYATAGARDITASGSWRAFLQSPP